MSFSVRSLLRYFDRPRRRPKVRTTRQHRARPVFETLEERSLLSITFSGSGNTGMCTITGTAGTDQFVIRMEQVGSPNIQFSDNNGQTFTNAVLANITSVEVDGLAGPDRLIIDFSNGIFGKTTAAFPITFNGGSGFNRLVIPAGLPTGQGNITESFFTGSSFGNGELAISNGQVTTSVVVNQVSNIIDEVPAASLEIFASDQNSLINIGFGQSSSGGITTNTVRGLDYRFIDLNGAQRTDQGFAGDPAITDTDPAGDPVADNSLVLSQTHGFIPITFANKGTLIVDGQGGNDLFVVNVFNAATGLTAVTIDGGSTGTDVVASRRVPTSVTLTTQNVAETITDAGAIYINLLYASRLARLPEAGAVAAWENFLSTAGAPAVAQAIEQAPEARTLFVTHLYESILGRDPMGSEAQGWIAFLVAGGNELTVLQDFYASPEFFGRAQTLVSTGTQNERFVSALYQVALGRVPADSEVAAWAQVLPTLGAAVIVQDFIASSEFRMNFVTTLYILVLHRFPDQGGLTGWVNSSFTPEQIRIDILGSGEALGNW